MGRSTSSNISFYNLQIKFRDNPQHKEHTNLFTSRDLTHLELEPVDIYAKAVKKEAKTQADLVINIIEDAVIVTNEITKFIEEEWMDYATFIVCYPNIRACYEDIQIVAEAIMVKEELQYNSFREKYFYKIGKKIF